MDILIWGCNAFAVSLQQHLAGSAVNIVGFVDPAYCERRFCDLPVFQVTSLQDLPSLPIIMAASHLMLKGMPQVDFESVRAFKHLLQVITIDHQIKNPVFHPAALVDLLDIHYPNKVVPFGLPGSGITLFSNICNKIIEYKPKAFSTRGNQAKFFERMCLEYTQCINQVITDTAHLIAGLNVHMASWKIGTTFAICTLNQLQMRIYSFATRNHVLGPVYGYHQIPSATFVDNLLAREFKLFYVMRNPLDMILSYVNKMGGVDKDTRGIKMDVFCHKAVLVLNQLKLWLPYAQRLQRFTYDNFVTDPVAQIKSIMRSLGIRPSASIAKKIWKDLSFKQLPTAPEAHFWRGGVGKWETYFKTEHFAFLKAQGIEEILQQYHFDAELEHFRMLTRKIDKDAWPQTASLIAETKRAYNMFYGDEHHDTHFLLTHAVGEANCLPTQSLYITGAQSGLLDKVKTLFDADYFNYLVRAGAFPDHRFI